MTHQDESMRSFGAGGVALVGCIIAGAGIGWLYGIEFILHGSLIGLGVGLVLMAFFLSSSPRTL